MQILQDFCPLCFLQYSHKTTLHCMFCGASSTYIFILWYIYISSNRERWILFVCLRHKNSYLKNLESKAIGTLNQPLYTSSFTLTLIKAIFENKHIFIHTLYRYPPLPQKKEDSKAIE